MDKLGAVTGIYKCSKGHVEAVTVQPGNLPTKITCKICGREMRPTW